MLTSTVLVLLSRASLIHSNSVPFITTSLNTVNTIVESMYSSLVNSVKVVVMLKPKLSTVLRLEVLSYVMSIGVCPGRVTRHVSCTVSLLDWMEQLYGTISPGQLMSSLETFGWSGAKTT